MKIPDYITKVITKLNTSGYECYLVGGCVRDSLMGIEPHDFDLTTNALPDEIISCFKDMRIIETGLKHGTVTVVSDGENVEITTYRIDGEYIDNRRPENVFFTRKIDEDLSRRDFTVNAIAYSPYGGYIDLFNGISDINNKIIKCVGIPDKRFNEDGLRIMRALRFSSVLSFDIDADTASSIHKNKELLCNISRERIYSEFKKLICGSNTIHIFFEYFDVLCVIYDSLKVYKSVMISNLSYFLHLPADFTIRTATLMHGTDIEVAKKFLCSLKPDKKTYNDIITLIEYLDKEILCDEVSVKRLMNRLNENIINKLVIIKKVLCSNFDDELFLEVYNKLLKDNTCVSISQLDINGRDLIDIGVSNGPKIGEILNFLLNAVIEEKCFNTKTDLVQYLKNSFKID